jgi:hypothetical protein
MFVFIHSRCCLHFLSYCQTCLKLVPHAMIIRNMECFKSWHRSTGIILLRIMRYAME